MEVRVTTALEWTQQVVAAFEQLLSVEPGIRICLPTGLTPLPVYAVLRTSPRPWAHVSVLLLDEFGDLPPGEPGGCDATLRRELVDVIAPGNYRGITPGAADLAAELRAVDEWIDRGGLSLAVLGVGVNGHLGMNEPGDDRAARTHAVTLAPETVAAADRYFLGRAHPTWGVTVGLGDLLRADRVWVLATGSGKAETVRRSLYEPVTPRVPASLLQEHPACTWWLDEAAASRLG